MFCVKRVILFQIVLFSISQTAFADLPEVGTNSGTYRGHTSQVADEVTVFQGIGYAAPPVGVLRWKPPAPAIPFAGVKAADRVGAACWQARNPDNSVYARGNLHRSEDCLYLNVFTGAEKSEDKLPVMVWFHGGGNTAGHGGPLIFDGSNLAKRGAVVITANYRLGAFGFLAHPALTSESEQNSSGMYGILDQLKVLQWVQNNVAGFGGDPDRVTIFGQSAGGTDVCLIMSSPLAEGLVDGVIGQSPGCIKTSRTLASGGHERGENFAEVLGIGGLGSSALEEMRELDPQQIVSAMGSAGSGGGPLVDGWVVPDRPYDLLEDGKQNQINVMVGGLADEYFGLSHLAPDITEPELTAYLDRVYGSGSSEVAEAYKDEIAHSPLSAQKIINGDNGVILSSRMWGRLVEARGNDAYVYYFTRNAPVFRLYVPEEKDLNGDGGQRTLGAYHSGELAYVFNNLGIVGLGWDDTDHELSNTMADYWVNFARNGNPNGPGLPDWPTYNSSSDIVQILGEEVKPAVHPRKVQLDRMENLFLKTR